MTVSRYEDMQQGARVVRSELHYFTQQGYSKAIDQQILQLVRKRLDGSPVRAYFIQQIYQYIQDTQRRRLFRRNAALDKLCKQQIPLIFEVVITIQYLHNQILDGKAGVTDQSRINDNLIAANLLKDQLYAYIDQRFSPELAGMISKQVRRAFQFVDVGQAVEKRWNTFTHLRSFDGMPEDFIPASMARDIRLETAKPLIRHLQHRLPREYRDFAELYFKRIYLTCAALFVLATELILQVTGYKGRERSSILDFAASYGLMRQMVNDNADCVPSYHLLRTHCKTSADAFSDLRNRNITLPLLFLLADSSAPQTRAYLQGVDSQLSATQEIAIDEEVTGSFAIYRSIQYTKGMAQVALQQLRSDSPARQRLQQCCEIANWNKFLFPLLRNAHYKAYKKSIYYKQLKKLITSLSDQPATAGLDSQDTVLNQLKYLKRAAIHLLLPRGLNTKRFFWDTGAHKKM